MRSRRSPKGEGGRLHPLRQLEYLLAFAPPKRDGKGQRSSHTRRLEDAGEEELPRANGPPSASSQRGRRDRESEQEQRRRFGHGGVFDLFWKVKLDGGLPLKSLGRHCEWGRRKERLLKLDAPNASIATLEYDCETVVYPQDPARYDPVAHARAHETFRQRSTPSGKSDTEREVRVEPEIVLRGALHVNRPRVR